MIEVVSGSGIEDVGIHVKDMLGNLFPQRKKRRKAKVPEALVLLLRKRLRNSLTWTM